MVVAPERKIMIVEDENIVARDLALICENIGYKVAAVIDSGKEALEVARQQRPDLVLMDIVLPGEMDGVETAARLRAEHHVPIIFVTGFADDMTIQRAKSSEPHGCILKPFDEREIRTNIELALYKEEAEEKLRAQEELLATILESVETAIIAIDHKGLVQFVNPIAADLTGMQERDVKGRNINMMLTLKKQEPSEGDGFLSPDKVFMDASLFSAGPVEYLLIRNDGKKITVECQVRQTEIKTPTQAGFVITLKDITERKRTQAQNLQAARMEVVSQLSGGIAHDFNNLTAIILGYATLIRENLDQSDTRRKFVEAILDTAQRSVDLTKTLLALAGKDVINRVPLNLNVALSSYQNSLNKILGPDIALGNHLADDLWSIKIDPNQVYQLVSTMASIARETIESAGSLEISTTNVVIDEEFCLEHYDCVPGEFVQLTISHTGRVFDNPSSEKVFEPFMAKYSFGKKAGLGLAVVFGIVKQNSGYIIVQSEPDAGTTFRIYFPRFYGNLEYFSLKTQEHVSGGKETILLVEDEKLLLTLMAHEMKKLGYEVLKANSALEALELVEVQRKSYDVLVTDMIMPGMNGKELIDKLKSTRPDLKAIVISGYTADMIVKNGIVEDGVNFLQKPFAPIELARKVRQVLDLA